MHLPERIKTEGSASSTLSLVTGEQQPYLSIVATTRNDDHGGDALARTQIFLDALAAQCERHGLDAELVLVEWNPPADRPGLRDALRWPEPGDHFEARIVEVPEAIHSRLENSDQLPLFQMIAKNVGIRRARGSFVLATNIDLIFSDELMQFLAERSLDPELVYAVDRYDVDFGMPDAPIEEQLEWCESHLVRINRREGTYELATGRFFRIYETPFPIWLGRWVRLARRAVETLAGGLRFALRTVSGMTRRQPPSKQELQEVRRTAVSIPRLVRYAWFEEHAMMRMHTNAVGDFTLLSREGWGRAEGYAEFELFSFFIDALFMYEAHYVGLRENVLPCRVYHMEHGGGWKPQKEDMDDLSARLEKRGIPSISYQQFLDWVIRMYKAKRVVTPRSETWGFSDELLSDYFVVEKSPLRGAALTAAQEGAGL
jgi:hypothetical protein